MVTDCILAVTKERWTSRSSSSLEQSNQQYKAASSAESSLCSFFLLSVRRKMWGVILSLLGWLGLSPTPYIATFIGATDPAIKLFVSILMGYPIAVIYHKYIRRGYEDYKNIFFIIAGMDIAWYNYGITMYHNLIPALVIYSTTFLIGPGKVNAVVTFVFNMTYLLTGYIMTESEDYDITWTMPQCVLTLKLMALAFDMWDGAVLQEGGELSATNKKTALVTPPTLPELIGFVYFPSCFLVGPIFSFKRYQDFVTEKYPLDQNVEVYQQEALKKLGLGLVYVMGHQIGVSVFSMKFMLSDEFWDTSIFYRHIYCGLWAHFALYKYISCWLLTEASCIRIGLSYNGEEKTESGTVAKWDGCSNIKLLRFETATKFQHYIDSFNCNTNHFAAEYIYKRLKFLGSREASQFCTLLFLAVWHGTRSGYYVTFLNEFLIMFMEKELEPILNTLSIYHAVWANVTGKCVLYAILKMYTIVFMGWSLTPFDLKAFSKWHTVYSSLYYSGFVLFLGWPFVHKPLLKYVIKSLQLHKVHNS